MSNTIDLIKYRHQVYLELCLVMVEEAYMEFKKGNHDLVEAHLIDVLSTFDREDEATAEVIVRKNNVFQFPQSQ
jgi:hypothetical protein